MSFIHHTLVGHFDPAQKFASSEIPRPTRPIQQTSVEEALANFPLEIQTQIELRNGYVLCRWAEYGLAVSVGGKVQDFAYALATREECITVELPSGIVVFPEWAQTAQQRILNE